MNIKELYVRFDQSVSEKYILSWELHHKFFDKIEDYADVKGNNVLFKTDTTLRIVDERGNNASESIYDLWYNIVSENLFLLPNTSNIRTLDSGYMYITNDDVMFFKHGNEIKVFNDYNKINKYKVIVSIFRDINNGYEVVETQDESRTTFKYDGRNYIIKNDNLREYYECVSINPPGSTEIDEGYVIDDNKFVTFLNQLIDRSNHYSLSHVNHRKISSLRRYISEGYKLRKNIVYEELTDVYGLHGNYIFLRVNEDYPMLHNLVVFKDDKYILSSKLSNYLLSKIKFKTHSVYSDDDVIELEGDDTHIEVMTELDKLSNNDTFNNTLAPTKYLLRANKRVNNYTFEPEYTLSKSDNTIIHGVPEHIKHFGVELEFDDGGLGDFQSQITTQLLTKGHPLAYTTRDGSVPNGFELKTIPIDYNAVMDLDWEKSFNMLDRMGYTGDNDTCGLHIHVSRSWLYDELNTVNLADYVEETRVGIDAISIFFMNYIMEKNWNEILTFTRRDYTNLRKWASDRIFDSEYYKSAKESFKEGGVDTVIKHMIDSYHKQSNNRYSALNVTPRHTIEFRLFRGTLDHKVLRDTVDFVNNITDIAKELTKEFISDLSNENTITVFEKLDNVKFSDLVEKVGI